MGDTIWHVVQIIWMSCATYVMYMQQTDVDYLKNSVDKLKTTVYNQNNKEKI